MEGEALVETLPIATLSILDVKVVIVFLDTAFDAKTPAARRRTSESLQELAASAGLAGDIVLVWQDNSGRTRFMAPPAQHPFFQVASYDQLHAQINGTLTCEPEILTAARGTAAAPPDSEPA